MFPFNTGLQQNRFLYWANKWCNYLHWISTRLIIVKASQATYPENWAILDAVRGSGKCLNPNLGNAETDSALNTFTTTATGFSFPNQNIADAMLNENGYSYIFLAIA